VNNAQIVQAIPFRYEILFEQKCFTYVTRVTFTSAADR